MTGEGGTNELSDDECGVQPTVDEVFSKSNSHGKGERGIYRSALRTRSTRCHADSRRKGACRASHCADRRFRIEAIRDSARKACGGSAILDGAARAKAEGFSGRVWNAQHRVGGFERQAQIESRAYTTVERTISCLTGSVFLV